MTLLNLSEELESNLPHVITIARKEWVRAFTQAGMSPPTLGDAKVRDDGTHQTLRLTFAFEHNGEEREWNFGVPYRLVEDIESKKGEEELRSMLHADLDEEIARSQSKRGRPREIGF